MTISNQTGETLVAHNEERNWGIWYLGGKDKSAPVSINAGETKEVFGIRASKGTATGYQGQYNVDGWSELPPRGHHFDHLLTITKVD